MPADKRYFIDPFGLRAFYIDKDPQVMGIVKDLLDRNRSIFTSDFVIQIFVQDLVKEGTDITKIQSGLKKVQMGGSFQLVASLNEEEFTNAKARFENLGNDRITLLEWAVLESMKKSRCNALITSRGRYRGLDTLSRDLIEDLEAIDILPRYGR